MDFATAVRTCLTKYVDFSGRARRSEYWFFALACVGAAIVGLILDAIVGSVVFYLLIALALLLPNLAAGVRRLHDTGKPWVFILIGLIPFVGGLILLFFYVQDSSPGDNEYGPNPKGIAGGPAGNYGQGGFGQPGGGPYGQPPTGYGPS